MTRRYLVLWAFIAAARLAAQPVRLRTVTAPNGQVSIASAGDTTWLSMLTKNGEWTVRADTATTAEWAADPAQWTGQAVTFVRLSSDYWLVGADGAGRDSILLSADSARAVLNAMRGTTAVYTVAGPAYLRFQVQRQAKVIQGTRVPEYPRSERERRAEGTVVARFVVDSTGRIDSRSVVIVSSPSSWFANAVRDGLRQMRFQPAQIEARNVAEVIEMPFAFRLVGGTLPQPIGPSAMVILSAPGQ